MRAGIRYVKLSTTVLAIVVLTGCGHDKPGAGGSNGGEDARSHTGGASGTGGRSSQGTGGSGNQGTGGTGNRGTDAGDVAADVAADAATADAATADAATADAATADAATADAGDAATADAATADAITESVGPPAPACDGIWPKCEAPVASYARDVAPILNAKCNNCHSPGPGMPWPLDTYADVVAWAPDLIDDLAHCTMPPPDGGTPLLTPAEHHAVANWLACDTPNN